jgi:hypothetical protein
MAAVYGMRLIKDTTKIKQNHLHYTTFKPDMMTSPEG